ncbi:MAG TPA: hypothetical protein PLO53_03005 [Candidatus Hydrogenedentes bacterium]|nr:hypothetical protein [Candidatus Hydrogenedentota bacterium]HPU96904.1 hypothetical protein [Candidatus Hydrogenedentota bacterium]
MNEMDYRQQAFDLAREFADTWEQSGREKIDFYKLLWVTHWAIENCGIDRVRQMFTEMMVKPELTTEDPAERLRLMIMNQTEDNIGDWFQRAMKS